MLIDDTRSWLYCLFLAIDANFRLKLKTRGIKDPELGSGLAYFVEADKFQKHLKDHTHEAEVSLSASRFRAIPTIAADRDLWGRVPRGKPSKFKVVEGFFGFRRWCDRLPSWPDPKKWRG